MPKKRKSKEDKLTPEEVVAVLDECYTRADPDEFERRFHELAEKGPPDIDDLF